MKCPRSSFETSGCASPISFDTSAWVKPLALMRAAMARTMSALTMCSSALGRPRSLKTLPLLFVDLIFFFIITLRIEDLGVLQS